jgi:histidinol dehydrogenase
MRLFRHSDPGFAQAFEAFVHERRETPAAVDEVVREVIARVRSEGLSALLELSARFDKTPVTEANIRVTEAEIEAGYAACPEDVRLSRTPEACRPELD